ncbi:hypothetical protein [Nocardiopsis alba]|uniref:hypothetical protein n=1 Tax=Nocardiopsis alba TaxID=53437 RepID=UPI0035DF82D6
MTAKAYETTDSDLIHERVMDDADHDGIILLHDIYDGTVPAAPGIIADLKDEGYTFVTVSDLLAPGEPDPGEVVGCSGPGRGELGAQGLAALVVQELARLSVQQRRGRRVVATLDAQ